MRAASVDLVLETGVDFYRGFALYQPSTPARAQDVTVGQRFYLDGIPELVAEATPENGGVQFRFREGLWWQPKLWLPGDESVMLAEAVQILNARTAWSSLETRHDFRWYTEDSGRQLWIWEDAAATDQLGQYAGTWPWDLYVNTAPTGWARLAEGALSIVRGEAKNEITSGWEVGSLAKL